MPQCVSKMVQVSNLYLQRGAAKIVNKALLKFGCKPMHMDGLFGFLDFISLNVHKAASPLYNYNILIARDVTNRWTFVYEAVFCYVTNLKVTFEYSRKKPCPTHLQTEKSNVSSRRNFPLGLRTGYSVKRVLPRSAIERLLVHSNTCRLGVTLL